MLELEDDQADPVVPKPEQPEEPDAEWPAPGDGEEDSAADAAAAAAPDGADDEQEEEEGEGIGRPAKQLPPETLALCTSAIEAMLFASAEPVRSRKIAETLKDTGIDGRGVRKIITALAKEYDEAGRGFAVEEIAGGFQMLSRPDYAEYIADLLGGGGGGRLSQAALETLSVVAYKQPVTRADIEAIRGVQAGPLLRALLHKGLIKITGRAEILGRPLLYGTTRKFLEHFGLKSLNELPRVEELPKP
ncbi:MAG: SMC-Scp complex subunit ScpB [Planctomycetota bacterium]